MSVLGGTWSNGNNGWFTLITVILDILEKTRSSSHPEGL